MTASKRVITGPNVAGRSQVALAFGAALRTARRERGFSQEWLAQACGLDRTYPSLLERGRRTPTITIILKLCEALELHPALLLSETVARLYGTTPQPSTPTSPKP